MPRSVTMAALACVGSPFSASTAEMPKLALPSDWVSSLKITLTGALLLPAASTAISRTVCKPSAKVPPASRASCAALIVNWPLFCTAAIRLVNVGLAPGSTATRNWVTPTLSPTTPPIAAWRVMPSLFDAPVSLTSAAVSVGDSVSALAASRTTVSALAWLLLPAVSVATRVKALSPRVSDRLPKLKAPLLPAVMVASTVLPLRSVSVAPASATPISATISVLVRLSPTVPVSLAASRPKALIAGATMSGGVLLNCATLAGATVWPLMRTLVGNSGAAMRVKPSSRPPTANSCTRCTGVPRCTSSPSAKTLLTGSTLT